VTTRMRDLIASIVASPKHPFDSALNVFATFVTRWPVNVQRGQCIAKPITKVLTGVTNANKHVTKETKKRQNRNMQVQCHRLLRLRLRLPRHRSYNMYQHQD